MSRFTNRELNLSKLVAAARYVRRHAILFAMFGVVLSLAGPAASADNGDPVIVGQSTTASESTIIQTSQGDGLLGFTYSSSRTAAGVRGTNFGEGHGAGVRGYSDGGIGVYGRSYRRTASGVFGENKDGGVGVTGRVTDGGVAVLADDTSGTGTALRTNGRLEFQNRSGIASVAASRKSVVVTLTGVTPASMVTATVQQTGGFYVTAAVPTADSFTIYINKAPSAPSTVKVAYLVLN